VRGGRLHTAGHVDSLAVGLLEARDPDFGNGMVDGDADAVL
jgi:hypothetical protein